MPFAGASPSKFTASVFFTKALQPGTGGTLAFPVLHCGNALAGYATYGVGQIPGGTWTVDAGQPTKLRLDLIIPASPGNAPARVQYTGQDDAVLKDVDGLPIANFYREFPF